MKISGFTMGKNISKLYYPMKESVLSILPIVDEFIVVLGDSDPDDTTRAELERIGSDKIRIIDSVWDTGKYGSGTIYAQQTHLAKAHCSGDWLFYIQADEVVHEDDLPLIRQRCAELLDDREVEGLLFKYRHFWGDYWHYHDSHGWYRNEIRIIRNKPEIIPWRDASLSGLFLILTEGAIAGRKEPPSLKWPGLMPVSITTAGFVHQGI
jgi:hypothetical protein